MQTRLAALAALVTLSLSAPASASIDVWASMRPTFGLGVSTRPQQGTAVVPGVTAGGRIFFPRSPDRAWVYNAEIGVAWTRGFTSEDAVIGALGPGFGHQWGANAISLQPRLLLASRDEGPARWGVQTGVRIGLLVGLLDVEVAHQYFPSDAGDSHAVLFTLGADIGQAVHMLTRLGGPPRRNAPALEIAR